MVSRTLKVKDKILVKFDFHYPTFYDGTLRTFALFEIGKLHNAWKDLEKKQNMSSI
jgi:hypothetical protein